jgi:hypothetical protein
MLDAARMFGFLPGPTLCCSKAAACYRAHFCGLCNVLRQDYGLWARWLINRDSTFLTLLGSALSRESPAATSATCCNPWARPRDLFQTSSAARYAGAVTVCGLFAKLDDDADDERGPRRWLASAGRRACDESSARAIGVLHALDFPVGDVMRSLQADAAQSKFTPSLPVAAAPTSHAYGEIVAHVGQLTDSAPSVIDALRDIGRRLGFLIYTKDAWDDWEKDRRHGRFNPLHALADEDERRTVVLPLVTQALDSLRNSFAALPLHRNRDLLSSMLVDGAEEGVRQSIHIKRADEESRRRRRERRNKEEGGCCRHCDGGCDCCDCCRLGKSCGSGSKGGNSMCDCNPCDGDGCECCGCDCSW